MYVLILGGRCETKYTAACAATTLDTMLPDQLARYLQVPAFCRHV